MTLKITHLPQVSANKGLSYFKAGFATALLCSMVAFTATAVRAQDSTAAEGQQLPPGFAQQQVPPSFPSVNDQPASAPSTTNANAPQTAASGQTPATSAPSQTTTEASSENPIDQVAAQPAQGQIPAQPEEKRLVPATAMGAAAQNADSGQGGQAAPVSPDVEAAAAAAAANNTQNPVEAAAAAADEAIAAQPDVTMPANVDPLEEFARRAEAAESQRQDGVTAAQPDDALPPSNRLNMVRLEGAGFENGNNRVTVGIDGAIEGGKTSEELQEEIRTEAFDAAITGMFPLSPEQIEGLLKRYDTTQKAAQSPTYAAPKPEISVQNVSLDPGVAPPVIKTAVGNVTTLNILDATGAPWPVQDVTWAGDYEIVEPEEGGHIIRITPLSHFARGNIVIRMLTLKTPLTMTLETGRDVVQYRVDARIPEYGPFATAPIMQGGKSMVAGSPDLTSILDGVMPGGAMKLKVAGVDGRTTAYEMGGTTFVRTPLTLLSPPWQSSVSSADGMNVYALSNAPVLLLSDGGEFQRATLSEKEDLLDE